MNDLIYKMLENKEGKNTPSGRSVAIAFIIVYINVFTVFIFYYSNVFDTLCR